MRRGSGLAAGEVGHRGAVRPLHQARRRRSGIAARQPGERGRRRGPGPEEHPVHDDGRRAARRGRNAQREGRGQLVGSGHHERLPRGGDVDRRRPGPAEHERGHRADLAGCERQAGNDAVAPGATAAERPEQARPRAGGHVVRMPVGRHDPDAAEAVARKAERTGCEAVPAAECEPRDPDGRARAGRDRPLPGSPQPGVDGAERRARADRRAAIRAERDSGKPAQVDEESGRRGEAGVGVTTRTNGEPDVVGHGPADDRLDIGGVERLRDRAGEHVVEARVPRSSRLSVPDASRTVERTAERGVELVERARRVSLGGEPERERCSGPCQAPTADDEVAPTEPLHGRSVGRRPAEG